MESLLLVVHVIIALAIVGLIMIQQGKGAEMGASFGAGSSQTVFGAAGSGNFFSRMTGILVAVFFATSLALAVLSKQSSSAGDIELPGAEVVEEVVAPAVEATDDAIPVADDAEAILEIPAADPVVETVESLESSVPAEEDLPAALESQ